jgi:hypothetical protein
VLDHIIIAGSVYYSLQMKVLFSRFYVWP